MPPPPQKPKSGTETVANPDLTTPDELEDDNMRVRKLKSRLIRLGTLETCLTSGMGDFSDFAPCGDNTPPRAQTTLATLKPKKQNGTRNQNNQNFKSSVAIDEVNASTV